MQWRSLRREGVCVSSLIGWGLLLWTSGCASPGNPRPPSLHLPSPVRDLSAVRVGDAVELHFTAPDETTDHQPLVHKGVPFALAGEICRVQGANCLPVAQMALVPGQPAAATELLPPPLVIGQGRPVAYRVRVSNPAGRNAGYSREALAAAGEAPAQVSDLTAATVSQGVQLTWTAIPDAPGAVRVEAQTGSAAAAEPVVFGKPPTRGAARSRLLGVPRQRDAGGAVDAAPAVGERVTYWVYREREVSANGQQLPLRSLVAKVSAVRTADVFPPKAPGGLLAVSFTAEGAGPSVSLSWEPNAEPDVAGYFIYRAAGAGAMQRITQTPVAGLSFLDGALLPGSHLRYAVTAVDRSGNESGRSVVTEVDVR